MRLPTLRVASLLLLAGVAAATDAPAPCFCLQETGGRLWYDCITYDKPTSPDPLYDCVRNTEVGKRQSAASVIQTDRADGAHSTQVPERERVPEGHTMTRIPDGQKSCKPCRDTHLDAANTLRPLRPKDEPSGASPGTGHD